MEQQAEIQSAAERLLDEITGSWDDPSSPDDPDLWAAAVLESDRAFRQRFGARAWTHHHIEAFHLGLLRESADQ